MHRRSLLPVIPFLLGAAFVSCVPARKYEEEKQRSTALQQEADAATRKALDVQTSYDEQAAKLADQTKRVSELERDTTVLGTSLRKMTVQYDKINTLNDELLNKYNALQAG
ncbi:MAG TPA: hypothetical protein PLL57_03400, partial [Flavobacteriales bacterium]|nr:hypothetical protein [Flavobacteriales bacterium]